MKKQNFRQCQKKGRRFKSGREEVKNSRGIKMFRFIHEGCFLSLCCGVGHLKRKIFSIIEGLLMTGLSVKER